MKQQAVSQQQLGLIKILRQKRRVGSVGTYMSSRVIPQIRDVILWKRIKIALQKASGYNHYFLLGLLLGDANATLVLFPGDGFDLTATVATVAWFHNKYVEFLVSAGSSKADGDVATLALVRDRDTPFVILILRLETGFEVLIVNVADTQTPRCCGRILHSMCVIFDLLCT
jgi:hypothetical protein